MRNLPSGIQAALALSFVIASVLGVYASNHTDERYVAYTGRLEKDGTPRTGTVALRFGVFATDTEDPACLANGTADCGTWAIEMPDVQVHGGVFSVAIGPIPDSLFQYGNLRYLGVAVGEGDTWSALGGLQALLPAPSAHGGPSGSNLIVAHDIETAGAVRVTRRQSLTVPGTQDEADAMGSDVDVHGWSNDPSVSLAAFRSEDRTQGIGIGQDGIRAIGTATDGDLHLRPKGAGVVQAASSVNVDGLLDVAGNLGTAGDLNVTGATLLQSTLDVSGAATLASLGVGGDVDIGGALTGGVTVGSRSSASPEYTVRCARLGDLQGCWGTVGGTQGDTAETVTLPTGFSFLNGEYQVVASAYYSGDPRSTSVDLINTTSFRIDVWTPGGNHSGVAAHFIALGRWQ